MGCWNVRGLVGGPEIVDFACSGADDRSSACRFSWKLKHLFDDRTERGTAVLVAGLVVMLSAMSLFSSSGMLSSKMVNGLLLCVCL